MLGLDRTRRYLGDIAKLGSKSGIAFKMHYYEQVFLVTLEPTGEKVVRKRPIRIGRKHKLAIAIGDCETCRSIVVGNICINKKCPTNSDTGAVDPK
jgi:hypothetical protein